MKRGMWVILLLTVSLWALAQTGGSSAGGAGAASTGAQGTQNAGAVGMQPQAGTTGATTPFTSSTSSFGGVSPSVLNTSTGTAFVNAPPSQPSLIAPIAHLGTAAPGVGATSATPGNMAGAVSSTMSQIPAMAPLGLVTEIANPVPVIMVSSQGGASPVLQGSSGLTISGTPGVPFNTGVGSFSGGYLAGTMAENQTSLGELARDYRDRRANQQVRMFTNDDVQRMNQSGGGVSVIGGTSAAAVGAGTTGTAAQPGTAPAVAQPGTMNPPASPGVATPVAPQANPSQPPPTSQMQAGAASNQPTEMAQATLPYGTQEAQAAPANAPRTQPRSQQRQLPSAGSVLPLVALVGFLATAAGLLAR